MDTFSILTVLALVDNIAYMRSNLLSTSSLQFLLGILVILKNLYFYEKNLFLKF